MSTAGRSVGYGLVLTLVIAAIAFLVDRSADPIIHEVERVVVPCQHGGEWSSAEEMCKCVGPWVGKYCGECACENGGVCDTNNIQVATPGSLWGCRCPDRLVGSLCEQCNANLTEDGRCAGPCKEGYAGPDCNRLCSADATFDDVVLDAEGTYDKEVEMLNYGGELHLCSGHGTCDDVTGFCQCEPFYFASEDQRSSCFRTCPIVEGKLCAGHGRCDESAGVVSCTCETGYHLSPACDVACPGMDIDYIQEPCSGRGSCYLEDPSTAKCECGDLFIGEACQYRCPTGAVIESSEACSGHGVCKLGDSAGYTQAVCECESPFQGPGCGCTRALTCSGHGECRGDGTCQCDVDPLFGKPVFRGERCDKCIPGHYGSDCRLQCTAFEPTDPAFVFEEGRIIHCHGRGTCAVANFGLAGESVVCGACTGNFAPESHCEECKDNYYPKFSVMGGDETASCTTYGSRATCNNAGELKDTFGRKSAVVEDPCDCDAAHANALSYCTECELSYYPPSMAEDPDNACSRRCVDKDLLDQGLPLSVSNIETLECKNDGVCGDDGLRCKCANGYSGVDCGIACGEPDSEGRQCSGHGECVANTLQQFLEFEINVKGFTASRCECSPQDEMTEAERLQIFRGELPTQTGEAAQSRLKRDWYGDTCGFACLSAPWKDGTECNDERCKVVPIADDAGTPILQCTQDSQCGVYEDGILKFYEAGVEKPTLTQDESKLRGAVSLSRRWSKRTGPFCHVPNTPISVWEPNMKCVQRVNKDGQDENKEVECHAYTTRYDCLHKGEGICNYVDVCMESLNDFDTWSYCYELMRTQEPPALRSKECAESCDSTLLRNVKWGEKCAHFRDRLPSELCDASEFRNVDDLCDIAESRNVDATALVSGCESALPPVGVVFDDSGLATPLDAADASAYCWETSGQVGAITYPFNFSALLDTAEARHLQSTFHSLFSELGARDACVAEKNIDLNSCDKLPEVDAVQANVLYLCTSAEGEVLEATDKTASGVACEVLPRVLDVSPFEMVCVEGGEIRVQNLKEVSLQDAVRLSALKGCALRAKSQLHATSVAVSNEEAKEICKTVLDVASPTACEQACGPEDACSDLGTTHDAKRVLQCRRPDASDVGIDPETGKCGNCLLGECSITGREGGAEYRCVVPEGELSQSTIPPTFAPCEDSLLLHVDELGEGAMAVGSVQGVRQVFVNKANETVFVHNDDDNYVAPARIEFDVTLSNAGRGAVYVQGKNGTLVSLLLHYYGGFGFDVNVPLEQETACGSGEGDDCKFTVEPSVTYRVVMRMDWNTSQVHVTFGDRPEVVRSIVVDADDFTGVAVSGTARVSQMWVFSFDDSTCSLLHRSLGRSLTMQASSSLPATDSPRLSMSFCAGMEKAVGSHVEGCMHEREAVFSMPWHDYCAYSEHLKTLTESGDCGDWQGNFDVARQCEPVLDKFSTPSCARSSIAYDWEAEYCAPLREDTRPEELTTAGCSDACVQKVAREDFAGLCDERDKYWDAATEQVLAGFLPDQCTDNGKWKTEDWITFCTEKAENEAVGYCSAAVCDCRGQGGWMAGDACELDCPIADDYSPCSEDSLGGTCTYMRRDKEAADAFYKDPDNNLIKNHAVMQIQGRCTCSHPDALAEEGCKVECDSPDGGPACNTRVYESNGTEWQLSACDAGGSGVCRCMSPLARRVNETVSNWRGQSVNVLTVDFGDYDGDYPTTAYPNMSAFRMYAHQGAKQLMTRYFGAQESVWETMKLKFESSPADFDCDGRECDFHDVVIAQSLYSSSSFYGGSCSRRCPGVDTGEDMVEMATSCDMAASEVSGVDRVSEEGCQSECLDDFRCEFSRWDSATSNCHMFTTCEYTAVSPEATHTWRERKLLREPNLTPCSGRGQCGLTGQCQCDPAKVLSLTNPITGEKNLIPSNKRGGFTSIPITTLDLTGYRGDQCEKVCPGYDEDKKSMADVCSGHGVCTRSGQCQCSVNWVGANCELRCPTKDLAEEDDQTVCSGHGTCSEARVFAGYDATEEDSKRYYMVTEAYRRWHNECPDNEPIDYFVLPFEEFPGSVSSADIVGGPDCLKVPQEQDDPNKPYVRRPEIKLDGLSDYQFLDDEKALDGELPHAVEGTSEFNRRGMFRRRYWYEDNGTLAEQTLFVENYARVEALYNETVVPYDKFYGYKCAVEMEASLQSTSAVETVADCASLCRALSDCGCFHYREFYHRRFRGECVLGKAGPLVAFPVKKVAYIHTTNGFLQELDPTSPDWADATPTPFDAFDEAYVQLHQNDAFPASCRAPTSSLGTNVPSLEDCAALCAEANEEGKACIYFSYEPLSRRCLQVRTTSAECVEGMTPNPAGFYAVSLANTGAIAPTAYTRSGSARIFPLSVPTRGTPTGTYVGRARPNYETAIASCDCLSNAVWGYWDSHRCHTCQKHYGSRTCSRRCPGVTAAGEPCFGFGKCLWGSVNGDGEEFYEARCLCGNPAAPFADDLATVGFWEVEEFELYVEATFKGLPPSETYEDPRNYNFASSSCAGCKEGFGGLNCASTCSYCLFGGTCSFTPSTVSVSVPCNCIGANYDPYNSCCPAGFMMLESLVHNDVGLLTTLLRRKRLSQSPGANTAVGKFYDTAVFPDLDASLFPSRRWCAPGPGMHESDWLNPLKVGSVCSGDGTLRDMGMRKLIVGATPSQYFPRFCSDLGSDAEGFDYWQPLEKVLWHAYPTRVFLAEVGDVATTAAYKLNGVSIGVDPPPYTVEQFDSKDVFADVCRAKCALDSCVGVVVRENNNVYDCYVSSRVVVSEPHHSIFYDLPNATFTAFKKQRQPEFCRSVDDPNDVCVLGSTSYGDVPLCVDKRIGDVAGIQERTFRNFGFLCEVQNDQGEWVAAEGADCQDAVAANKEVRRNENTNALSQFAPDADALIFGAHGNDALEAAAGEVTSLMGVMRPDNPCASLQGDYFWNKDNRSQCVSATTRQSCSIQEWRHCVNYGVSERVYNETHSAMETLGVHPHKLYVLGHDVEVTVQRADYSYRIAEFDSTALEQELAEHNAAAAQAEADKQADIDATIDDIDFVRVDTGTYAIPHVFEWQTNIVDMDGSATAHPYSFYEWVQFGIGNSYSTVTGSGTFNPFTWPREQVQGCESRDYDNLNAAKCLPMGLQQLHDVTKQIYDSIALPTDDFWLTNELWTLNINWLNENFFSVNHYTKFWNVNEEGKSFYGTRLLLMCVRETYNCQYNNLIASTLSEPHSFDKCYVTTSWWGSGVSRYKTVDYNSLDSSTYDDFTDDAVCPAGCQVQAPTSSGACYTCVDTYSQGECIVTTNIIVPSSSCLDNECNAEKLAEYKQHVVTETMGDSQSAFVVGLNSYLQYYSASVSVYYQQSQETFQVAKDALEAAQASVLLLQSELATMISLNEAERVRINEAISSGVADAIASSCTEAVPCDICQGHCESTSECREGLTCTVRSPYAPWGLVDDSWVTSHCSGTMAPRFRRYCLPLHKNAGFYGEEWSESQAWRKSGAELFVVGAVVSEGLTSTWIVEVEGVKVVKAHSRTQHHYLGDVASVVGMRSHLNVQLGYTTGALEIQGNIYDEGIAGKAGAFGRAQWIEDDFMTPPRSVVTNTAEACAQLCEELHGCTAAHWDQTRCLLFHFNPDAGCLLFEDIESGLANMFDSGYADGAADIPECGGDCDTTSKQCAEGLKCFETENSERVPGCRGARSASTDFCFDPAKMSVGFVREADACHLCRSQGLRPHVDTAWTANEYFSRLHFCEEADYVHDDKMSEKDGHCALFPTFEATTNGYAWQEGRESPFSRSACVPTRANIESGMHTHTVLVGKSFASAPFLRLTSQPEMTTFSDCESACAENTLCVAWQFEELFDVEERRRRAQLGQLQQNNHVELRSYVCTLYDSKPTAVSTASASSDIFDAQVRVGYIDRDFSSKVAFFDDGEHPACDCYKGSTAYSCGCLDASFLPFRSDLTVSLYGCAGHGRCSSLEYKCVCDAGYAWLWAEADEAADEAGYTCRPCPQGTFKDSRVATCTRCPVGTYQDETGAESCKSCPEGFTTLPTLSAGMDACVIFSRRPCEAGTFQENPLLCTDCPSGYRSAETDAATCDACQPGYYSGTKASECLACASGTYSEATATACTDCPAGKYSDSPTSSSCRDCNTTLREFSVVGAASCSVCTKPNYAVAGVCTECPKDSIDTGMKCEYCHDVTFCRRESPVYNTTYYLQTYYFDYLPEGGDCSGAFEQVVQGGLAFYRLTDWSPYCTRCLSGHYYKVNGKHTICYDCPSGKRAGYPHVKGSCDACEPGYYQDETEKVSCKICPKGYAQVIASSSTCEMCPEGKFAMDTGLEVCENCTAGRYQNEQGGQTCKTCAAGKFILHEGATSETECEEMDMCIEGMFWQSDCTDEPATCCVYCDPGKSTPENGVFYECLTCPAGWSSTGAADKFPPQDPENRCKLCNPGYAASIAFNEAGSYTSDTYHDASEWIACRHCAGQLGLYQDSAGQAECLVCPSGFYASYPLANPYGCKACPNGFVSTYPTPSYGSSNGCKDPVCDAGSFSETFLPEDCQQCPSGYFQDHLRANDCLECPSGYVSQTIPYECVANTTTNS